MKNTGRRILTGGLSIGPLGELDVGLVPLDGIGLQVSLQGTTDNAGSDVRVVHVTGQVHQEPSGNGPEAWIT